MAFFRCAAQLLVLMAMLASASAQQPARIALVIGNGSYKEGPLRNPPNDADDIAKALGGMGFAVTIHKNIGLRDMRRAVRTFGEDLRNAQAGLFYFAGHGVQVRGNNYLMPTDGDIQTEADVEDQALDANYVLRTMEDSKVPTTIVILDACRNNPYARGFRSGGRGLAQMNAATGSLIAFATAPGSEAADGTGRNGTYTKHLLQSLQDVDTDILKVFQRTRAAVVYETRGRQTPWESTSLVGDFYFRPTVAVSRTPIAPAEGTRLVGKKGDCAFYFGGPLFKASWSTRRARWIGRCIDGLADGWGLALVEYELGGHLLRHANFGFMAAGVPDMNKDAEGIAVNASVDDSLDGVNLLSRRGQRVPIMQSFNFQEEPFAMFASRARGVAAGEGLRQLPDLPASKADLQRMLAGFEVEASR